jgi:hypothetical protein
MEELPVSLFDVFALSLPRGHGFGDRPPISFWKNSDESAFGVITCHLKSGDFGILAMRRRVDGVWTTKAEQVGISSKAEARAKLTPLLHSEGQREPMPPNKAPRPFLHNTENRKVSDIFRVLKMPSHHVAAWMLNQLYLALPNPDKNWAADCQTGNFHTRLWEAQLLASFREQGLLVTQPETSPDFRIENRIGNSAWVEAVTANPTVPYNHVNSPLSRQPTQRDELFFGTAAVRFAKTLGNKLQNKYHLRPHVVAKPFMLAIADFHAPASMIWSREALIGYLYGLGTETEEVDGNIIPIITNATHLLGDAAFPAGLFTSAEHSELSAVIFSNACSIAKLNRVGISGGADPKGYRYTRIGNLFDRTPGALKGIPFCLDITSDEYRSMWPQGYEPWSAELEVFHNPYARHPVPRALLPEATHWFEQDAAMVCESFYQTAVLWSNTLVQNKSDKAPTLKDFQ